MSKDFRSLAAGLSKSVAKLFGPPHQQISLPIEISVKVENRNGGLAKALDPLTVTGKTQNMSHNEISFVVPYVRIGEQYLAGHGEQKQLKVVFELPNGTVRMKVKTVCYEMINLHDSVQQYLITTEIMQVNEGDSVRYKEFLKHGMKSVKTSNSAELAASDKKASTLSVVSN